MKTPTHTDTTRAISHIAPATRSARSRAFLFLAAACALAPAANAAVTWDPVGPDLANFNVSATATVSGSSNTLNTAIVGTTSDVWLTFTGAALTDKLTFSGSLANYAGNIAVTGGTITVSAANTNYAGKTTISGGVLSINNNTRLGSNAPNDNIISTGGTLEFYNDADKVEYARGWTLDGSGTISTRTNTAWQKGVLQGNNADLVKEGGGTLILYAQNTYTGKTIVNAGLLYLRENAGVGIAASSGVWVNNSATFTLSEVSATIKQLTTSASSTVDLQAYTLTISGTADSVVNGTIIDGSANTGALAKEGSGKLTLTKTNTYNGGTTITGGTVSIASNGYLGDNLTAAKNLISNATLELTGNGNTYSRAWTLSGNVIFSNANNVTQSGALLGSGTLTKTGAGTLTLSGTGSTYSGRTIISDGAVSITANNRLGTNDSPDDNILNGTTLELNNTDVQIKYTRGWTLNGDSIIHMPNSASTAWQEGVLQGTGNLIKTGSGTLILYATNTLTGKMIVREGALRLRYPADTAASVAGLSARGIYLEGSGQLQIDYSDASIKLLASESPTAKADLAAKALTILGAESSTFAGVIVSTNANSNLIRSGTGTLTLSGANTYTGATTINESGILALSGAGSIATSSGVTLAGSGKLNISALNGDTPSATLKTLNGTDGTEVVLGGKTLNVSGAGSFAGLVSGTGKLEKSGTDTLSLTRSNNTYSGGTTISGGTLSVAADGNLGTNFDKGDNILSGGILSLATEQGTYARSWTLGTSTTNTITNTVAVTQSGVLGGTGALTKTGAATLTLTGENTYTGLTTVSAGVLALADAGSIALSNGVTLTNSAEFNISNVTTSATIKTLNATPTTTKVVLGGKTLNVSGEGSFKGVISGDGGRLVKSGTDTLTLTNSSNSYTGGTTISGGTLSINANAQLGSNNSPDDNIISTGGILEFTNSADKEPYPRGWTIVGSATLSPKTHTAWQQGVLQGDNADLVKEGANILVLYGQNTYTGKTIVNTGEIYLRGNAGVGIAASSGVWVNNSAYFTLSEVDATIKQLTTTASSTVDLRAYTLTISGIADSVVNGTIIDGDGNIGKLVKGGTGKLTLTKSNSYGGGTTITGGTVSIASNAYLGSSTSAAKNSISNATLELTGANSTSYSREWTLSNSVTISNANNVTQGGTLTGTGTLIKKGAGKLTLSVASDYSGGTKINAGTVSITANNRLGSNDSPNDNVLDGGILEFNNTDIQIKYARGWTLVGDSIIHMPNASSGSTAWQQGVLQGSGNLIKTGPGGLLLYATNTFTGKTIVRDGFLGLRYPDNEAASVAGISTRGIYLEGSAQLMIDNFGASIKLLDSESPTTTVDIRNTAVLTIFGDEGSTFAGKIYSTTAGDGKGKLIKSGASKLTLTNPNNAYSNGTEISGGTISISVDSNLGSNKTADKNKLSGGTLELTGVGPFTRLWEITANSGISVTGEVVATQSVVLSGAGGLTKSGTGTLVLSATNTYTGGTTVAGGVLSISSDDRLGTATVDGTDKLSGGTLLLTGAGPYERPWVLTGVTDSTISTDGTVTQGGILSGTGSFTKNGSGTLTLTGANTYEGSTTIAGGILVLTGAGAISTNDLSLSNGAKFNIANATFASSTMSVTNLNGTVGTEIILGGKTLAVSGKSNFAGTLTGTAGGKLEESGGDITLTGTSALAAIDVTSSNLSVNGTLTGVGGGDVTIDVNTAGILGGTGSIKGAIFVHDGGTLSPGNSVGTLNVNGAVNLEEGATLFVEISGSNGTEVSDVVVVAAGAGVFTFWAASIVEVNLRGFTGTAFEVPIVTSADGIAFDSGDIGGVTLRQSNGWELSLSLGDGGKSVVLTGMQVPEPSAYALFGAIGAVALALVRRRKNKK